MVTWFDAPALGHESYGGEIGIFLFNGTKNGGGYLFGQGGFSYHFFLTPGHCAVTRFFVILF